MSRSTWPNSDRSEPSSIHIARHEDTSSEAGSDTSTSLVKDQARFDTPTTLEFGSHIGYTSTHDCPASAFSFRIPTPLPIRAPKGPPKGYGLQKFCNWELDLEQNNSRSSAQCPAISPKRAHSPDNRSPTRVEEPLDTPETYSPGAPKLDPGHHFAAVVDEVVDRAVEKFCSLRKHASETKSVGSTSRHHQNLFRPDSDKEPTDAWISASEASDGVFIEQHTMETRPTVWPCPFFVKDKKSHISCLTRHCLLSMTDVREHLCLMHRKPIYCSVCYETFLSIKLRDIHMRSWKCLHKPPRIFDGITDAQVQALDEQDGSVEMIPQSQLSNWLKIWQIVFPCAQPLSWPSPFNSQELEIYELRRFWKKSGKDIISDVLREYGLQEYSIADEERSLDALFSLVADRAVDDLLLIQAAETEEVYI